MSENLSKDLKMCRNVSKFPEMSQNVLPELVFLLHQYHGQNRDRLLAVFLAFFVTFSLPFRVEK